MNQKNTGRMKRLLCAVLALGLVTALAGCKKDKPFPPSEDKVTTAVSEVGLDWSLEQTDAPDEDSTIFTFSSPDEVVTTATISTTLTDKGPSLQMAYTVNAPADGTAYTWEDFKAPMALAAKLYGGFEDADAIYTTCSAEALPQEDPNLFNGLINDVHCSVITTDLLMDWTPEMPITVFLMLDP